MMSETLVHYDCKDQIATLTLNRPDRLNAFSDELVRHLMDALRRFDLDPEAPVELLHGVDQRHLFSRFPIDFNNLVTRLDTCTKSRGTLDWRYHRENIIAHGNLNT